METKTLNETLSTHQQLSKILHSKVKQRIEQQPQASKFISNSSWEMKLKTAIAKTLWNIHNNPNPSRTLRFNSRGGIEYGVRDAQAEQAIYTPEISFLKQLEHETANQEWNYEIEIFPNCPDSLITP